MKNRRFGLPISLLAAFGTAGVSASPTPPRAKALATIKAPVTRTFGETVGLNVKFGQGQPMDQLPQLKELGVRWVRDGVGWPDVEPSPGQYVPAFTGDFAKRLTYYRANNIGLVFLLAYDNSIAYPNTPENPHHSFDAIAYGKYAAATAKLLKASGVKFVLELWNEPHNFGLAKAFGGAWNAKPPSPWVDHYIKMVSEAVTDVKAYDPKITLLDDDDMWIIHYWLMEKGLPPALDGFAFHPYAPAGPERSAIDQNTDWVKPFTAVDADGSFTSAVRRLREQGRRKLGHTPQLWATEWGWETGGKTPTGPATEDKIAALLPRSFILAYAAGVRATCWFSMEDSVDGPMGLVTNAGTKRKQYFALRTLTRQIGSYSLVRQVAGGGHQTSGLQAYLFHGPGGYTLAAWDIDGTSAASASTKAGTVLRAVGNLGQPVTLVPVGNDRVTFSLGPGPVYLTDVPASVTIGPARASD